MPVTLTSKQERVLIERAKKDLVGMQELFNFYFPKIYAYANYRVFRVQDAEDIVATVFLRVAEKIKEFRWRGDGSFSAWIFRIARDHIVDFYRNNSKEIMAVSLDELPQLKSTALLPDDITLQKEKFENLRNLIRSLSPRRQEIITLKFFGGLQNKEIAQVLRLDERTVASHLCRGLKDLHLKYNKQLTEQEKEGSHD